MCQAPKPEAPDFSGLSLNNLGQVVGSYEDSAGNENGFLYSGGKYIALNAPGASGTFLDGINDFGQVVGTAFYSNGSGFNFIDTRGKFTVISNAISPLGSNAINDRDQVLGNLGFPNYGVLNSQGIISPIDTSGANGTALVEGFNNLDQLAGELCDSVTCHGFTETNGVFTKSTPPTPHSRSPRGLTIWVRGWAHISTTRAMVFTPSSIRRAISPHSKTRTLPQ